MGLWDERPMDINYADVVDLKKINFATVKISRNWEKI